MKCLLAWLPVWIEFIPNWTEGYKRGQTNHDQSIPSKLPLSLWDSDGNSGLILKLCNSDWSPVINWEDLQLNAACTDERKKRRFWPSQQNMWIDTADSLWCAVLQITSLDIRLVSLAEPQSWGKKVLQGGPNYILWILRIILQMHKMHLMLYNHLDLLYGVIQWLYDNYVNVLLCCLSAFC